MLCLWVISISEKTTTAYTDETDQSEKKVGCVHLDNILWSLEKGDFHFLKIAKQQLKV